MSSRVPEARRISLALVLCSKSNIKFLFLGQFNPQEDYSIAEYGYKVFPKLLPSSVTTMTFTGFKKKKKKRTEKVLTVSIAIKNLKRT